MAATPKKKCFVISPIGDAASTIRAEADWLLKGVICPALEPEFEVERADVYPMNDVITNQVILAIKDADLIVANLTGHNPNVFYELAVAHAFERPVVPMIHSDQAIPFDNKQMGTIKYSRERIEQWELAKTDLRKAAIAATRPGHKVSNPITLAIGVGRMQASGDPKEQILAKLTDTVNRHELALKELRSRREPRSRPYASQADYDSFVRTSLDNNFGDDLEQLEAHEREGIVRQVKLKLESVMAEKGAVSGTDVAEAGASALGHQRKSP